MVTTVLICVIVLLLLALSYAVYAARENANEAILAVREKRCAEAREAKLKRELQTVRAELSRTENELHEKALALEFVVEANRRNAV